MLSVMVEEVREFSEAALVMMGCYDDQAPGQISLLPYTASVTTSSAATQVVAPVNSNVPRTYSHPILCEQ